MTKFFNNTGNNFSLTEEANKLKWTVQIPTIITAEDIENIVVDAFEASDMYMWAVLDKSTPEWANKPKDMPSSQFAVEILLNGGEIKFCDVEGAEDDSNWILTLEKLLKGIQLNATNRPHDCDLENADGDTIDCIMQYAILGDIVFG